MSRRTLTTSIAMIVVEIVIHRSRIAANKLVEIIVPLLAQVPETKLTGQSVVLLRSIACFGGFLAILNQVLLDWTRWCAYLWTLVFVHSIGHPEIISLLVCGPPRLTPVVRVCACCVHLYISYAWCSNFFDWPSSIEVKCIWMRSLWLPPVPHTRVCMASVHVLPSRGIPVQVTVVLVVVVGQLPQLEDRIL